MYAHVYVCACVCVYVHDIVRLSEMLKFFLSALRDQREREKQNETKSERGGRVSTRGRVLHGCTVKKDKLLADLINSRH